MMLVGLGQPVTAASPPTAPAVKQSAVTTPPPAIRISEPDYRFQSAIEGQTVTHDFLLRNEGQGTLVIKKLRAD